MPKTLHPRKVLVQGSKGPVNLYSSNAIAKDAVHYRVSAANALSAQSTNYATKRTKELK